MLASKKKIRRSSRRKSEKNENENEKLMGDGMLNYHKMSDNIENMGEDSMEMHQFNLEQRKNVRKSILQNNKEDSQAAASSYRRTTRHQRGLSELDVLEDSEPSDDGKDDDDKESELSIVLPGLVLHKKVLYFFFFFFYFIDANKTNTKQK